MTDYDPAHIPVLTQHVMALLCPQPGQVYVDATAGLGGHALQIAKELGPQGVVVLNDLDAPNLERAAAHVRSGFEGEIVQIHGSFADLPSKLKDLGHRADLVLADLGFASNQVGDPSRGLTFKDDGPLDMRLDQSGDLTASDIVHDLLEEELANVIFQYGEERASRRIARAIVTRRKERRFETTGDLADVVRRSAGPPPKGRKRIDRATRTFQAIRIAVNGELESLESLLSQIRTGSKQAATGQASWLKVGARVGVIAFHSLEDRPVKRMFVEIEHEGFGKRLTRKPAVADEAEETANPRSRSAKLRVLQVLLEMCPDRR